ncbi:MAG: class I SAM-dependent methyltransferase [Polyangiales bacterium]
MSVEDESACPLCEAAGARRFHTQSSGALQREFRRCEQCRLVFVPRRFHLSPEAERTVYEEHENDANDPRYRAFLSRLFAPMRARLADGASGLDFGCGPGPTLSAMFRESGLHCADYDPMFADDQALLSRRYDYILASEVFEHLCDPGLTLRRLTSMLRPGGWLGVMTKRLFDEEAFARWHYIRDPTHVAFFSDETFAWIGRHHGFSVEIESPDVVLLRALT